MHAGPEPGWWFYEGYVAEYRAARAAWNLELPPGVSIPPNPAPEPEHGTLYQHGAGEVAVLFHWLHAVQRAAVDCHRSGNDEMAQHWVEVAAKHVETETFAKYNDPHVPVSWFDAVIIPARTGDFSMMTADVESWP